MTLFHAVFQQNQSSLLSEENFHGMRRRMVDEFSANFSSARLDFYFHFRGLK